MMRMKTKPTAATFNGGCEPVAREWELRPGGMLVQKRHPDSDQITIPPAPTIRVKVKYGSIYHQININSQATFGELKKMLTGPTGLHHKDQKLIYKDKERDSNVFLDMVGVKDKSKMVLMEDPISQEKRLMEMRKNAKMEKASKSISEISFEVDRLAGQVSAYESIISKGGKVNEKDVVNLIELLMNQLLKLDGIMADGDVKLQRKMQVRRVQKYVETLDMLKIKNSMPDNNGGGEMEMQSQHKHTNGQRVAQIQERYYNQQQQQSSAADGVVVTTKWETFDSFPALVPVPSTSTSTANNSISPPKFPWEFFD
ncbi:BAG family molecular chaperone regulator 3 [Gossypium arboreum]|uniref:Uncharacterized protein n=2 Tax=Gossypium arboreum TaxID=29729 RepID=A0ABR0MY71_GOSAR|nr:BAG family molecular chaperone regulator 1 [Gossypium arboreum]KAK5782610.1 hypothetical protein PVK06_037115 [Gossypium arboreum]KHG08052.1 BAG family molecular chaperone regulator 3 [Gossypium arboreum]